LRQSQAGKGFRGDHRLREKQRILIVDDDYLIAALLAKVLEAAGRQVVGPVGYLATAADTAATAPNQFSKLFSIPVSQEFQPAAGF
jgi:CheY-like chemotaxis protein